MLTGGLYFSGFDHLRQVLEPLNALFCGFTLNLPGYPIPSLWRALRKLLDRLFKTFLLNLYRKSKYFSSGTNTKCS